MDHQIIDIPQKQTPILSWHNLDYNVRIKKKQADRKLLNSISGSVYPGELVAIMGSSGAGKTTLINALSGRIVGGKLSGDIKFNGKRRDPHSFKRMLAYVEQDDLMHSQLTVEETLTASAQLRLPNKKYTLEDKRERVEMVMRQLRLAQVRDTKIGGNDCRGVSGGERKRASIGMELVTDPAILVLDEPTSGLDSSSAEMVVSLTKEMARQRNVCTLMTIHQPSPEMVAQFDKLILLAQGKLVYMGPADKAVSYFENLGYPSTHPNPANFFIDLMTVDFESEETTSKGEQKIQQLVDSFVDFCANDNDTKDKALTGFADNSNSTSGVTLSKSNNPAKEMDGHITYMVPDRNSWWHEMVTLFKRDWLLMARHWPFFWGFIILFAVLALSFGFVFFQMGNDQSSAQNRIGLLLLFTAISVYQVVFPTMSIIAGGLSVLHRERSSGSYRMTSYLIAKALSFAPLIYGSYTFAYTVIYFLSHLQYEPGKFFIGLANMFAVIFASIGLSFVYPMSVRSRDVALVIALATTFPMLLFAGNLSNTNGITPVLRWIKYVCPFYYEYSGFMQNEFGGLRFTCDSSDTRCFQTGQDVLNAYGLNEVPIWLCVVANLAMGIGFYLIAYCLLRWRAKPRYLWI